MRKRNFFAFIAIVSTILACFSCAKLTAAFGKKTQTQTQSAQNAEQVPLLDISAAGSLSDNPASRDLQYNLMVIAESERRDGYKTGSGMAASSYQELLGRYAPAVFEACKDLFYAKAYGVMDDTAFRKSLKDLRSAWAGKPENEVSQVYSAIDCIESLLDKNWNKAKDQLRELVKSDDEFDSFGRWLWLVSVIQVEAQDAEKNSRRPVFSPSLISTYGSMMSRYRNHPEYWYYAMQVALNDALALDAAERCINLAPGGPYAILARQRMAKAWGIETKSADSIKTIYEIQEVVRKATESNNLGELKNLFPLLALADNPATLYALGVLREIGRAHV